MNRTYSSSSARDGGFTLVELMVTMLVAAILLSIAIPTYTSQQQHARRTDARSAALDMSGREERYFSVTNTYSQTPTDLGYTGAFPLNVGNYYQINVTATAPTVGPPATPWAYLITVTPATGSSQVKDTTCASFTVNQIGQHKSTDSSSADSTATCWAGN